MILLYLNRLREFIFRNENIVKFGYTKLLYFQRLMNYPNFSEIYIVYKVNVDNNIVEQNILKIFNQLFIQESDYGTEYFRGDFKIMAQIIELYLTKNEYTFEIVNLYDSFIQNSISNQMIYNSENWNVQVYNHIQNVMKKENITVFTKTEDYIQFYKNHFCIKKNKIVELTNEVEEDCEEDCDKNYVKKCIEEECKEEYNKNEYYICHHCCNYRTNKLKDIKQHINRKNKCKSLNSISYEDASLLSINKKFIFKFDISILSKNDHLYIIQNYINPINYIDRNYIKKIINNNNNNKNNNKNNNNNNNNNTNNNNNNNNTNFIINDNNKFDKTNEFDKLYFNFTKQKYICILCFSEYTSKQNMEKHLLNNKKCEKRRIILETLNKNNNK